MCLIFILYSTLHNIQYQLMSRNLHLKILKTKILYENIKVLSPDNLMEMTYVVCYFTFFFFKQTSSEYENFLQW